MAAAMAAASVLARMSDDVTRLERITDNLFDEKLDADVQVARAGIMSAVARVKDIVLAGGEPELEVLAGE